jgi:hypothetical protein
MSNTNPTKPRGWTRVLLKGKQFLFDHWHLPCTSIESICTILLVVNHDVIMGDMHDAREVFQFIPPCFCLSSYYPIFFISLSFFSLAGCLSGLYCFMKLLFQVTFFSIPIISYKLKTVFSTELQLLLRSDFEYHQSHLRGKLLLFRSLLTY